MKRRDRSPGSPEKAGPKVHLPKDALSRIRLGHSFAEYDPALQRSDSFVITPQVALAADPGSGCFFVGRRGTGKTATTVYLLHQQSKLTIPLTPQIFEFQSLRLDTVAYRDTRQRPFRSLLYTFFRAIIAEAVRAWFRQNLAKPDSLPPALARERNCIEDQDFDVRVLSHLEEYQSAQDKDREWLRLTRRASKEIPDALNQLANSPKHETLVVFDRIDEAWDGSEQAVLLLMALMHACVELTTVCPTIRPRIFLRENIFERVREVDNEFARLETFVVSMDWSREQLLEMIERRLNLPFNTKLPLRGPTWDHFFESTGGESSRSLVFDYCQDRPRDVLTYCSFAIEAAQGHKHERITIEDLQSARKRFSDSRLKDLGDEYAENFPQIQLILSRFYGLGTEFTVPGIEAFIKKLLVDDDVKRHCGRWLYHHTTTDRFVHLLYNIGFVGIKEGTVVHYRSLGAKSSAPPALSAGTHIYVHPSYHHALNLRDMVIGTLDDAVPLQQSGMLLDLPDAIALNQYRERLQALGDDLKTLPVGLDSAAQYETIVGEIIKLCFFRALQNLEQHARDVDGRVVRDWIAANRAQGGFWEMVRQRYGATQIIWECKNYEQLQSSDFHQFSYYATAEIGRFAVCSFRGEVRSSYYEHIKRISNDKQGNGLVLLFSDRDLQVFIRQAIAGKAKEDHVQDCYDKTVRAIS